MSPLEKGVILMVAILFFVFALCIGLSWYSFQYVDWKTVSTMGLMLLPVVGAASIVVLWTERRTRVSVPQPEPRAGAKATAKGPESTKAVKPAGGGL